MSTAEFDQGASGMYPSLLSNDTLTLVAESPDPSTPRTQNSPIQEHEDYDISIIWTNLDARSDFSIFRKESRGPIERILADFARVLESGLFKVYSVNASKNLFCVVVACEKNSDEGVMDLVLSVY